MSLENIAIIAEYTADIAPNMIIVFCTKSLNSKNDCKRIIINIPNTGNMDEFKVAEAGICRRLVYGTENVKPICDDFINIDIIIIIAVTSIKSICISFCMENLLISSKFNDPNIMKIAIIETMKPISPNLCSSIILNP